MCVDVFEDTDKATYAVSVCLHRDVTHVTRADACPWSPASSLRVGRPASSGAGRPSIGLVARQFWGWSPVRVLYCLARRRAAANSSNPAKRGAPLSALGCPEVPRADRGDPERPGTHSAPQGSLARHEMACRPGTARQFGGCSPVRVSYCLAKHQTAVNTSPAERELARAAWSDPERPGAR